MKNFIFKVWSFAFIVFFALPAGAQVPPPEISTRWLKTVMELTLSLIFTTL